MGSREEMAHSLPVLLENIHSTPSSISRPHYQGSGIEQRCACKCQ
ncbi:uncharacterized protein CCOS01_00346 [Colletotrichum costaricense]|uniref:Uncharacterized protein n=1 Tax=Colletotrichum costaricense TaxID=1209916 RepID=A0AAI9ZAN6_9PEZI|nr:uncharacterized protein CCOS01_00346 [Colletotrichum costaricense]KAK1539032.1 hypothetical protein CCOS01_00346 [Colletotrichum costaricense]